ncbi:MAG: DNA polymerase III subunit gamma/tau [Candidatus Babeliales bacterium]|jgi:DNA polymerase III subunit gamma/tau
MAEKNNLNLARKWRPQTFDHVVGQNLSVTMLKNSLALNKLFPVYLFSGQRGCGKTSTARIFAAAINCENLPAFQHDALSCSLPCLECTSCQAMSKGDHPDFIEIDAASHTGVDNVRQIIDAANYLPLLGRKKVYLIDEAHMLSKAAFNACLKILEEPPISALFILATTEVPKIPATIASRCFQAVFNPLKSAHLKEHIRTLCVHENINIDDAALDIIIDETEGSVRDAINLLERIRFSQTIIDEQTVLEALGKISAQDLFTLFTHIINKNVPQLLEHLTRIHFEQRSPQLLWDMIIQLCRALIWTKYNVTNISGIMARHTQELATCATSCSLSRLTAILTLLWSQEEIFLKTTKKHLFLEMTLLQLCQQVDAVDLENLIKICNETSVPTGCGTPIMAQPLASHATTQSPYVNSSPHESPQQKPDQLPEPFSQKNPPSVNTSQEQSPLNAHRQTDSGSREHNQDTGGPVLRSHERSEGEGGWGSFLQEITHLNDPLLCSIFAQATFVDINEQNQCVTIQLSSDSAFFKNKIEETRPQWLPLFTRCFKNCHTFAYVQRPCKAVAAPALQPSKPLPTSISQQTEAAPASYVPINNATQWPKASLILHHFPGKIRKTKTGSP